MNRATAAKELRAELKMHGIKPTDVSVRKDNLGYDTYIDVLIKNVEVPFGLVRNIANKYNSVRCEERTLEILQGSNIFVHVEIDPDKMEKAARKEFIEQAKAALAQLEEKPDNEGVYLGFDNAYIYRWADGTKIVSFKICKGLDENGEKKYDTVRKGFDKWTDLAEWMLYIKNYKKYESMLDEGRGIINA